jgi:hypothetical protein
VSATDQNGGVFRRREKRAPRQDGANLEGDAYPDTMSEVELLGHFAKVATGDEEFLIVERTSDPSGMTYLQAATMRDGTFVVEHQFNDMAHHFMMEGLSRAEAESVITAWLTRAGGWDSDPRWHVETL